MWCDVKKCRHNQNGYCQNKDYISIDAHGKCDSNTVIEDSQEDNNQSSDELTSYVSEKETREKENEKPKAKYLGYHDGDTWYQCPVCEEKFGGFSVMHQDRNPNGTKEYCPGCKRELRGVLE